MALLSKWDSLKFKKRFASSINEAELKSGFLKQFAAEGACKIVGEGEGDGEHSGVFPIACAKVLGQARELSIETDDDGKVNEIYFRPKEQPGRCK